MTDLKGKGRASPADMSDTDSDDDVSFFTMKPRTIRSLPKIVPMDEISTGSGSSDSDTGKRKKKKRSKKPVNRPALPAWTRAGPSKEKEKENKKRRSTEDRQSKEPADVYVISSDEDNNKRSRGRGKEKEREASQSRITLTPPPEVTEAERAKWREAARKALPPIKSNTVVIDDEDDDVPIALSSSPLPRNAEKIYVNVSMSTDRENLPPEASEKAIRHWETRRKIYIFRDGKLDMLWHAIAQSWKRNQEDIILCHNGHRIYSKFRTAREVGIDEGADITGYMKPHWDRLELERQRELDRITRGESIPPEALLESEKELSPKPQIKKIKISLRGEWGTKKIAVPVTKTGSDLAIIYCTKCEKDEDLAPTIRLMFDGEVLKEDETLEDIDADDGDMIDVEIPAS